MADKLALFLEFLKKGRIVSQEQADQELAAGTFLVTARVADIPTPAGRSIKRECGICHEPVWLREYNDKAVNIVCLHCVPKLKTEGEA